MNIEFTRQPTRSIRTVDTNNLTFTCKDAANLLRKGRQSDGRGAAGTGSVSCNSVFLLHLCRFLNQEDLMEREAMVQNP